MPRRSCGRSTVSTGHQQGRGQGWGPSGAHLVHLLVGDVEDVQEVPLAQPALDVGKPGAVVHWGEVGGEGGPEPEPHPHRLPQSLPVPSRNCLRKASKELGSGRNLARWWKW